MKLLDTRKKSSGDIKFVLVDQFGNVKSQVQKKNLIVDTGRNLEASRLGSNTNSGISHIGFGVSTLPTSSDTTQLGAEFYRKAISNNVVGNVITFSTILGPGEGTGDSNEAGLLNASTSGLLYSRATFPTLSKSALDSLYVTWVITIN